LIVVGGRGASASADWSNGKQLTLPDCRGRVVANLDDMGNSAASRLTSSYFGASGITLGAVGGGESLTLTAAQLPAHTHPNTLTDPGHSHTVSVNISFGASGSSFGIAGQVSSQQSSVNTTGITINNAANTGGGNPHRTVQPTILATTYIKM